MVVIRSPHITIKRLMKSVLIASKHSREPICFEGTVASSNEPKRQERLANMANRLHNPPAMVLVHHDSTVRPGRAGYPFDRINKLTVRQRLQNDVAIARMVDKQLPERRDIAIQTNTEEDRSDDTASKPPASRCW